MCRLIVARICGVFVRLHCVPSRATSRQPRQGPLDDGRWHLGASVEAMVPLRRMSGALCYRGMSELLLCCATECGDSDEGDAAARPKSGTLRATTVGQSPPQSARDLGRVQRFAARLSIEFPALFT